jgi:hypothetical protein
MNCCSMLKAMCCLGFPEGVVNYISHVTLSYDIWNTWTSEMLKCASVILATASAGSCLALFVFATHSRYIICFIFSCCFGRCMSSAPRCIESNTGSEYLCSKNLYLCFARQPRIGHSIIECSYAHAQLYICNNNILLASARWTIGIVMQRWCNYWSINKTKVVRGLTPTIK